MSNGERNLSTKESTKKGSKQSAQNLKELKGKRAISMITCYDRQMAFWLNQTHMDAILVGDTVGEIIYGFPNSTHVTMEIMLRHTQAVAQGAPDIHIIGDMPYQSYDTPADALRNAHRFLKAGADSIKMEDPPREILQALCKESIPVCGHVGLTPQTIHDYKLQGRDAESAARIRASASMMADEGCYAIVLEAIPKKLAADLTQDISIPTIGIAAGKECDGQIRVLYDIAGLTAGEHTFAPALRNLGKDLCAVVEEYIKDIQKPPPPAK